MFKVSNLTMFDLMCVGSLSDLSVGEIAWVQVPLVRWVGEHVYLLCVCALCIWMVLFCLMWGYVRSGSGV